MSPRPVAPADPASETLFRAAMAYATADQADPLRCFVCGRRDNCEKPLVAVLKSPLRRNSHHWVCPGPCHDLHRARCAAEREGAATGLAL